MAVKPIELIALDIDGTLLTSESELSTRTYNVLQQAKKQGIRIILATGRILKRTLPLMKELELQDYLVVHNGAIVYDNRTNKIALKRGISLKLASDIIARLEKEQIIYYVFTGESGGEEIIAPKYV